MTSFDRVAGLEVEIDGMTRSTLRRQAVRWERRSTVITLTGGGVEGVGEDISYEHADQEAHGRLDPLPFSGRRTLAEWSAWIDEVNLFPVPPAVALARDHRRWAYDGALLDLALRQAGMSLAQALGREERPLRFCVSPSGDPLELHAAYPDAELKIDAQADWDDATMRRLHDTGRVRVVDLKAHYHGTWVEHPDDPVAFAGRVAEAFPDAVLEDPPVGDGMDGFYARHAERTSFDAPIHSLDDLLALPQTGWCNIKPSRFGTVERLLACIDHCEAAGIRLYGGGQFELGPGRDQIQRLAATVYPDGPNDVAPSEYNVAPLPAGLGPSPLAPRDTPGFG